MADVFRVIPGVVEVLENGSPGWRTDHGADLIIDMVTSLGTLEFEQRIVVQVKSYSGRHEQLDAVGQVESGIKEFEATAGLIVTTAERTEALEERIAEVSQDIDRPIELLAGDEVAKFVLRHAPDKLFRL